MLRLSVVCHRIVADYEKSIDTKMNDFNLCFGRIKVTSTIASHSPLNIWETVRELGSKGPPIGNGRYLDNHLYWFSRNGNKTANIYVKKLLSLYTLSNGNSRTTVFRYSDNV